MINYIIARSHELISQKNTYLMFQEQLKQDETFSQDEKKTIRFYVNQVLARYYRHLYILDFYFDPFLHEKTIIVITLYAVNEKHKDLALTFNDVLTYLETSDQSRIATFLKPEHFPLRIPEQINTKDRNLALAIRFSVPVSLIEQLQKDIGKKNIINFLAKFYRDTDGILNIPAEEIASFFSENPLFKPGLKQKAFIYEGKENIKQTAQYNDGKIIMASASLQDICEEISSLPTKKVLFYQFEDSVLILLIAIKFKDYDITYASSHAKSRFVIQHLVQKFNLQNVKVVQKISETYELVVATLNSSNINGNLKHRDFYVRLPENLDPFATVAKEQIHEVINYVGAQNYFMFVVKTIVRQETHYQALNLLNEIPAYKLLKEKQYFHFNEGHESLYYALFKHEPTLEGNDPPSET